MDERKIAFGIVCRGRDLPAWQGACLRHLLAEPGVELRLILDREAASPGSRGWACLRRAVRRLRSRLAGGALRLEGQGAAWPGVPVLHGAASPRSLAGLDFLLDLDAESRAHDLVAGLPLGVWRFQVGSAEPGAGPPLLAELRSGEPVVEVLLLRLGSDPARAAVLMQGAFRLAGPSLWRMRRRVLFGCAPWPARLCRAIRLGAGDAAGAAMPLSAPRPRSPRPARRLALLRRLAANGMREIRRRCAEEKWAIGWVDRPVEDLLSDPSLRDVRWLPETQWAHSHCDPFAPPGGGAGTILAERFDYRTGLGSIVSIDLEARGGASIRPVLERPFHLSWPYLLAHDGQLWCVPESAQARHVALLRAAPFPERFEEAARLLEGMPALDPTVFVHEGRWWLLCTRADDEPDTKLFAFVAPDLVGPWTPHPLNPLKCDPRSSRPAGPPFLHEGVLYRPAQDCSERYGGALVIQRVRALGPAGLHEETVARFEPDPAGPYPDGLHTLCPAGPRTLVDGKRLFWSPRSLLVRALRRRRPVVEGG